MARITKPVPGFEAYSVSNLGEAYGQRGQLLTPDRSEDGYLRFRPMINGRMHSLFVHRAVLLAFDGDPPDDEHIFGCHKDGVTDHNWIENLYWGTYEENWADRKRHGNDGRGLKNGRAKFTQERADELRMLYATGDYSYQQLGDAFGISQAQANKIGRGLYWPAA